MFQRNSFVIFQVGGGWGGLDPPSVSIHELLNFTYDIQLKTYPTLLHVVKSTCVLEASMLEMSVF